MHPLATVVEQLAQPIAQSLGLELVQVVFHTNQRPPVMRVDIRHLERDTSHSDCEAMSRALEGCLAETDPIPGTYVLEVSSPGITSSLSSDRDFEAFKGFPVAVTLDPPMKGRQQWTGTLLRRDEQSVWLSCKGRPTQLPRAAVQQVQLLDGSD